MFGVPVLILLGFSPLVSLNLDEVWVTTVFFPVVDTFTAAVFPFGVIADAKVTLPEPFALV